MRYGVILFYTTSSAMQAQKILKTSGNSVKLIPVPREFSSDCGVALRFNWAESLQVKESLEKARVEFEAIHEFKKEGS